MKRIVPCAALAVLAACAGCISVEIETRADRAGGGTRSYAVTLEQSLAKTYQSATAAGQLFRLPGDDLVDKPGVALLSRAQQPDSGGALVVRSSFRAARLTDAATATDSVQYAVERRGWWVWYRYREHYLGSDIDSTRIASSYGERYRFRHVLRLPGRLVASDADSVAGGEIIWSRPMGQVRERGLVMTADSREPDLLACAVLLLGLLAVALLGAAPRWRRAEG
ncbi:MAG: hypothetical protein MUF78_06915 [Candidatus Edwardsbacteria bacterium]|jgi:hypothetical protein|nr:hypothetical protein [Candidatus Edwardsbacteria bacterium]